MRDYEIQRGLRHLLATGSGSPPTLPQFIKACKQADEAGGMERNHSPQLSLPKPEYCEPVWAHAQRCLLSFLWQNEGASDASLQAMIAAKNSLVQKYQLIGQEDVLTGTEIRDALFKAWRPLWKPRTAAERQRDHEHYCRTGFAAPPPGVVSDKERAA